MHNAFVDTPGKRLKWAREKAGIKTATEAADALSMARPTYLAHENDSRGYRAPSAARYARKFKVSMEWLLTGRGDPEESDSFDDLVADMPPNQRQLLREYAEFLRARKD